MLTVTGVVTGKMFTAKTGKYPEKKIQGISTSFPPSRGYIRLFQALVSLASLAPLR
jgi:hypothetical protein